MTQQFIRIVLFSMAIGLLNTTSFAQQTGGATRGSSAGQTPQGTTETRPTTQSGSTQRAAGGSAQLSSADQAFVKEAAMGGLMEVELGRLATEKASNAEVKQFAQRMVDDHGKANEQLSAVAQQKNVQVPSGLTGKAK